VNRADRILAGALALVALLLVSWLGVRHYGAAQYQAGQAAAIAERARLDADAVLARTRTNAKEADRLASINTTITKEKDDEITDLRQRLAAAGRLRVGAAVCPGRPAAGADTESTAGGDGADTSGGLVSARADADFKQLILDVETDLATGRACQAFVRENGLEP
jgi:hypothetical protein